MKRIRLGPSSTLKGIQRLFKIVNLKGYGSSEEEINHFRKGFIEVLSNRSFYKDEDFL